MDVVQVLHMNGGFGDESYATNSSVQAKVISMTKPIREEAMVELCHCLLPEISSISIAELGCSVGPNALSAATEFMTVLADLGPKLGLEVQEVLIQLNDLPQNDFNSIFQYGLSQFRKELRPRPGLGSCFISAVPGSFYGRLFPAKSLHFVHSSYSLMWLSQVPEGVEMNKENIYMVSTSPTSVISAYYKQFQKDFSVFLKSRSEEVVSGGKMVLTILGRKSDDASGKDGCYIWELIAHALQEMVSEGLIEEEDKLHSFHIPQYTPSPFEVKEEVNIEGSFIVNHLEASEIMWDCFGEDAVNNMAKCMRSVAEPLLVEHFGELVIDPLFKKYRSILSDSMSKEQPKNVNVTISMTRK